MSSLHRIRVLGRELQVRSSSHPEQVREIESFVNGRLAEVAAAIKGNDPQLVAILTLMNIAEAYLSSLREQETSQEHDAVRIDSLLKKLDTVLQR